MHAAAHVSPGIAVAQHMRRDQARERCAGGVITAPNTALTRNLHSLCAIVGAGSHDAQPAYGTKRQRRGKLSRRLKRDGHVVWRQPSITKHESRLQGMYAIMQALRTAEYARRVDRGHCVEERLLGAIVEEHRRVHDCRCACIVLLSLALGAG